MKNEVKKTEHTWTFVINCVTHAQPHISRKHSLLIGKLKVGSQIFHFSSSASSWWGDGACWYGNWLVNLSGCQCTNSHSNRQAASQHVALLILTNRSLKGLLHLVCDYSPGHHPMCPCCCCSTIQNATSSHRRRRNPDVPYPPNQENHSHTCTVTFHKHTQRCSKMWVTLISSLAKQLNLLPPQNKCLQSFCTRGQMMFSYKTRHVTCVCVFTGGALSTAFYSISVESGYQMLKQFINTNSGAHC